MAKRALILLHEGVEEMEAMASIDILRRGGIDVITASTSDDHQVTGRSKITFSADSPLSQVVNEDYDCIILPGGPGINQSVRDDDTVKGLIKRHFDAGKWVAAICAAPLVFKDIGILRHKQYTAHPTTTNELSALITGKNVVVDSNVITSAGAGTATAFALKILALLTSESVADAVAESICLVHAQ